VFSDAVRLAIEAGLPGFEAVLHYGLMAPAGTHPGTTRCMCWPGSFSKLSQCCRLLTCAKVGSLLVTEK